MGDLRPSRCLVLDKAGRWVWVPRPEVAARRPQRPLQAATSPAPAVGSPRRAEGDRHSPQNALPAGWVTPRAENNAASSSAWLVQNIHRGLHFSPRHPPNVPASCCSHIGIRRLIRAGHGECRQGNFILGACVGSGLAGLGQGLGLGLCAPSLGTPGCCSTQCLPAGAPGRTVISGTWQTRESSALNLLCNLG